MRTPPAPSLSGLRRRPRLLIALSGAATAALIAWVLANRELNEPPDRTGAASRLDRVGGPLGATPDAHLVAHAEEPQWVQDLAGWVPQTPRTPVGVALAYLWALPLTLAGLVLGLLTGAVPTVRDGVILFAGGRGPMGLLLARRGFAASTLGHVVISRTEPTPHLLAHELAHTRQAERLGLAMGPVYAGLYLRYGYARHPMERAARIAGRRARVDAAR